MARAVSQATALPVRRARALEPGLEPRKHVIAVRAQPREPDEVVDARDLEVERGPIEPECVRHAIDVEEAVAEAHNLGLGVLPPEMRDPGQHRVRDLENPRVRTELQNILHDRLEELELMEVDPERFVVHHVQAAAVAVAEPRCDLPALEQAKRTDAPPRFGVRQRVAGEIERGDRAARADDGDLRQRSALRAKAALSAR